MASLTRAQLNPGRIIKFGNAARIYTHQGWLEIDGELGEIQHSSARRRGYRACMLITGENAGHVFSIRVCDYRIECAVPRAKKKDGDEARVICVETPWGW